jgi:hypothetical protein
MTTVQDCVSQISDHIRNDNGHKHLENGAIQAFHKDLADLQKHDNKLHSLEFAAGKAATEKLVGGGMIPSLKIENKQAVFVAGATADHKDLVISVGREADKSHHAAAVMDADGVYWGGKTDGHGHWMKDESKRIGDADQFKAFANKQLGQQADSPLSPNHAAPEPSNFESLAAYNTFHENMGRVYNRYDLNGLAECYKNMNRSDRVRTIADVQTYNSNLSYSSNSADYISIEERHGKIVVSVSNHERTLSSDAH